MSFHVHFRFLLFLLEKPRIVLSKQSNKKNHPNLWKHHPFSESPVPRQESEVSLTSQFAHIQCRPQLLQQSDPCRVLFVLLAIIVLLSHQRVVEPGRTESTVSVWISSLIGRWNHWSSVHPRGFKWAQRRGWGEKKNRTASQVSPSWMQVSLVSENGRVSCLF